jgi:hypothetical protein
MASPLSKPLLQCLAFLVYLEYFGPSRVLAQNGDGGGADGVEPGDLGGPSSPDAGAAGQNTGSVNLSKGATIAISVVVSVVVLLGGEFSDSRPCPSPAVANFAYSTVTMAVLFFTAKKRQWTMKETLRRSAKKVGTAVKAVTTPLTPKKMTFSPIETRQRNEAALKKANDELSRPLTSEKAKRQASRSLSSSGSRRDLEKGLPEPTVKVVVKDEKDSTTGERPEKKDKKRPRPPSVSIPSSAFEMDSPKTPMWKKVFGR